MAFLTEVNHTTRSGDSVDPGQSPRAVPRPRGIRWGPSTHRHWAWPSLLLLWLWSAASIVLAAELLPLVIAGQPFRLELALTPQERATGLMYRDSLPADGGMLFVDTSPRPQGFYMKNCRTDIDIAFLDGEGRVVATYAMKAELPRAPGESEADYDQRMPRYLSGVPAQFALELRGGRLKELGIGIGDRLSLPVSQLVPLAR